MQSGEKEEERIFTGTCLLLGTPLD